MGNGTWKLENEKQEMRNEKNDNTTMNMKKCKCILENMNLKSGTWMMDKWEQ